MTPDPERDDEPAVEGEPSDEVVLGPGGVEDPETEWHLEGLDESIPVLTSLDPGELILLRPGEDPEVTIGLPKPRHLRLGIAFSGKDVILCSGKARDVCRNRLGFAPAPGDPPVAQTMTVVFIEHRADGNRMRARNYIVVTSDDGSLLGWLDYSDSWGFAGHILRGLAEQGGLEFHVERYPNEPAFQSAHPNWVG